MNAGLFVERTTERERARQPDKGLKQARGWSPECFAEEQIRGLVQQLFLSNSEQPFRQVVFSGVEPETDVRSLCFRIGEALAMERVGSIAVVGEYPDALHEAEMDATEMTEHFFDDRSTPLRQAGTRLGSNLWLVPPAQNQREQVTTSLLHSYMGGVRKEFEYSIVVGPAQLNAAMAMARLADGIVLVLSARHTRRITARKVKEKLEGAQARLLGTVLSDRVFPIPEAIYRRL
jgi:hypothetical protein